MSNLDFISDIEKRKGELADQEHRILQSWLGSLSGEYGMEGRAHHREITLLCPECHEKAINSPCNKMLVEKRDGIFFVFHQTKFVPITSLWLPEEGVRLEIREDIKPTDISEEHYTIGRSRRRLVKG